MPAASTASPTAVRAVLPEANSTSPVQTAAGGAEKVAAPSGDAIAASSAAVRPAVAFVVAQVVGADALAARLAASGLWPGAPIELLVRAPFGGPLLFLVHGYRLALRRNEAERVLVLPAESRS